KNYYAGGIGSVRGYKSSTLGTPKTMEGDDRLGGNRKVIGNAELLWTLPGLENTARLGLFFDAGQVYASGDKLDAGELRYSVGVTAAWMSPVGPLKFSIGTPLNKKSGDEAETFQFQLGTTF
ncbi:MAG: BamA/TamA family outer membrane protein, partial [Azonexus sp.]